MKNKRIYLLLLAFAILLAVATIIGANIINRMMPLDMSDLPAYHYDCKMLIDAILLGSNILSDTLLFIYGIIVARERT
jgi:hypothetical protein